MGNQVVVNRLTMQDGVGVIAADENFLRKKALLLPAQLFRFGAELSSKQTRTATYSLQSFWALRRENAPRLELEKIGLARVLGGAEKFYGVETENDVKYFIAAYPDLATSQSCVACHNAHPDSRRRDFNLGDVMGGIVIRIPFADVISATERSQDQAPNYTMGATEGNKAAKLNYRDIADLVYAVVAANREAYSKVVVDRLMFQDKVIEADEDFLRRKALPLPAQLFSLGALLTSEKSRVATYSLRSVWALNKDNMPKTDLEKAGLISVAEGSAGFYGMEASGTAKDFVAVYLDRATDLSCVTCHNNHEKSPRRNFGLGDVMGGIVIRIPMVN